LTEAHTNPINSEKCSVLNRVNLATERHHVTYEPEVIKGLCEVHHLEITAMHTHQMKYQGHGLSNKQRWYIWYKFTQGKKRVKITKHDLRYRYYKPPFLFVKEAR